jgi:hypothetical protein
MRVAPAGLAGGDPFSLGCQAAALTHGHPSGYLAAGAFALMVSELVGGRDLRGAAGAAISRLERADGGDEATAALTTAFRAAEPGPLSADAIGLVGQGWTAEEALAIATHCALTADRFRSGVLHAVNHDGDSDKTPARSAAICSARPSAQPPSTATCSRNWKATTSSSRSPMTCTTCSSVAVSGQAALPRREGRTRPCITSQSPAVGRPAWQPPGCMSTWACARSQGIVPAGPGLRHRGRVMWGALVERAGELRNAA